MNVAGATAILLGVTLLAIGWRGLKLRPFVQQTMERVQGLEGMNPDLWGAWVFRTPEVDEILPTLDPEKRRQVEELRRHFEREEAEGRDGASLRDAVKGFKGLYRFTRIAPVLVAAGAVIVLVGLAVLVA